VIIEFNIPFFGFIRSQQNSLVTQQYHKSCSAISYFCFTEDN